VPVEGVDAHLPPLEPEALSGLGLRRRFATPPAGWQAECLGDGQPWLDRPALEAAVLVPLVHRPQGVQVLLTQRATHLRDHAGQISFPGGRRDEGDADTVQTALREAEEEIGLARRHIDVIGQLPVYQTVTRYAVTPVVALVRPGFVLRPDAGEVAEAFEVPLEYLMNPAHHQRHVFRAQGHSRQFLSMPWHSGAREYFIWGATAAMLRNLYGYLRATSPQA
jgi:8-oxo-dGTP pyrophosphatase MutT (NUDIX family)